MKEGGHPEEQPPLRGTQARRLAASIPLIHSIAQAQRGQINLESGTVNNAVLITRRMIDEFRYVDGWIGVTRNGCFEQLLNRKSSSENDFPYTAPCSHIEHAVKKSSKKEGRRINPLQVSPEGFHRNCLYSSRYPMFVYGPSSKECHLHL